MWSNNKKINIVIDVLIFLVAINVFHYGQLILPIICLILFVDNKFQFKVNNRFIFIILCLFGISFFLFSYKMGFYSVMGFCIPMAYYIGSNVKDTSENNVKKLIYLIAFGMAIHVLLNFGKNICIYGTGVLSARSHYDIWLKDSVKETITAVNFIFLVGCSYYLFFYEKNKTIKYSGIIIIVLMYIYNIGLGRRTPFLMIVIAILFSIVLDGIFKRGNKANYLRTIKLALIVLIPVIVVVIMFKTNAFGLKTLLYKLTIVEKFGWLGLKSERFSLVINAIKIAPEHLWGGQEISKTIGNYVHDLWMDTFDYAGVVSYALLVIYTISYIVNGIKLLKNKNVSNEIKILIITLYVVIFIQLHMDPIMSGSSLFLICTVLIGASIEKMEKNGK